ncbi:MAG: hypothetical protein ACRDY1_15225 [Acidimicrobiales bacterium]
MAPGEERDTLIEAPSAPVRHRRVSGRVVLVLVVILLIIGAAGGWYYKRHHSPTGRSAAPPAAKTKADQTLATTIGIQLSDLGTGWTSTPGTTGDAFAANAQNTAASTTAQTKATATLAGCLKVAVADVSRAFGGPTPNRTAAASTPTYIGGSVPGTAANSVVDVMRAPSAEHADQKVFADPTTFASCYQSYAQSMLAYAVPATAAAANEFTSVTVAPATVPAPSSSRVHTEAFTVTRVGKLTSVTTAVAVFGGRLQATLNLVSSGTFPATTESTVVAAVEARVTSNLRTPKTTTTSS